ncbi:MAG: hypothetical protein M1839_003729 [Geoglossum umbratile]|nr:MAG: hypothetical protein M1839_003729 [Geoglossum umbratile]
MHPYHEGRMNPSHDEIETLTDASVRMDSLAPNVQKSPKGKNPERTDQERFLKTTVLVNNLHCASCVSHVQTIVGGLYPAPLHISANILTLEVIVRHTADLHVQSIYRELHNAGFELRSLITEEEENSVVQEPASRSRLSHTRDTSRSSLSAPTRILELEFGDAGQDGWLEKATECLSMGTGVPSHRDSPPRPYGTGAVDRQKQRKHIENCHVCKIEAKTEKISFGVAGSSWKDGVKPLRHDLDKERSSHGTQPTKPVLQVLRETRGHEGDQYRPLQSGDCDPEAANRSGASPTLGDPARGQWPNDTGRTGFHETDDPTAAPPRGDAMERGGPLVVVGEDPSAVEPQKSEEYKASLSVGGMTCSACAGAISGAIEEFSWVKSVNVNLLSNSASIIFEGPKCGIDKIMEKVQDLGYDCVLDDCSLIKTPADRAKTPNRNARTQRGLESFEATLSIGGMTCGACTAAVGRCLDEIQWLKSHNVNLLTNSAAVVFEGPKERIGEVVEKIEDLGYDCTSTELAAVAGQTKHVGDEKPLKSSNSQTLSATLSIGGMTCAVCVGAISQGLEMLSYVKTININLLTNSGVVVFEGKQHLDEIVEKVEDLGYECSVEDCTEVRDGDGAHGNDNEEDVERTMAIKIAGMFCEHCPPKLLEALRATYSELVAIDKAPTLNDPIIRVRYKPNPPDFTIRDIISAIQGVDDNYKATIYHPPTIEERSRAMQRHEQYRLLIRLFLCMVIAIPTFLIGVLWMSIVPESNGVRRYLEERMWVGSVSRATWALLFLSTPVMFFAADVFHVRAIKEIRALWRRGSNVPLLRRFYRFGSMNLLISAGTTIAYLSSIATLVVDATRMPMAASPGMQMQMQYSTTYFDTVVFLTMFILLGRFLEAYSKAKTGDAVTMLGKLRPTEAILLSPRYAKKTSGYKEEFQQATEYVATNVSVDLLEVGDIVRITHGSSPPADGVIVSGTTKFDESSLTGESRLVSKVEGDKVFAGTVNQGKPVSVRVALVSGDSMLDQIVKVVREGQTKRAPVERLADILTGYFVPVITLLAVITFVVWFALGQSGAIPKEWRDVDAGGWAVWALGFAIAVFVVACPCGIGLAAPTALFVGSGLAAKYGILVKGGGEAFQEASGLDVIVFDKTGTLTEGGDPRVTDHDMLASDDYAERLVWSICYALEETSSHPMAKAILGLCEKQPRMLFHDADIEEVAGRGLKGTFSVKEESGMAQYEAIIGNENFMRSVRTLVRNTSRGHVEKWKQQGKSIALLSIRRLSNYGIFDNAHHMIAAQFAIADTLRPEAPFVIKKLQQSGVAVWMLSGDNITTATAVGAMVGIPTTNIIADVLPEGKAKKIQYLQRTAPKRGTPTRTRAFVESQANPSISPNRAIVAMVGDGINDSPALTMADVGIAIGSGSDVAISSAKFVLVGSDLGALLTLTTLSRAVFRRVKFNFAWALVYNMAMLPVAAGVLYPLKGHVRLDPVWASLAMALR